MRRARRTGSSASVFSCLLSREKIGSGVDRCPFVSGGHLARHLPESIDGVGPRIGIELAYPGCNRLKILPVDDEGDEISIGIAQKVALRAASVGAHRALIHPVQNGPGLG